MLLVVAFLLSICFFYYDLTSRSDYGRKYILYFCIHNVVCVRFFYEICFLFCLSVTLLLDDTALLNKAKRCVHAKTKTVKLSKCATVYDVLCANAFRSFFLFRFLSQLILVLLSLCCCIFAALSKVINTSVKKGGNENTG